MDTRYHLLCLLILLGNVMASDLGQRAADPVAHLTSLTDQISSKVTQLNAQVTALKSDVATKTNQITSLNSQLQHAGVVISNLTHLLNQKGNQLTVLDTYCKNQVAALQQRATVLETPVAFSVRFNNDNVTSRTHAVGAWQYLLFDVVQYQTGGANYDNSTGLFSAPSSGTYAFFLTAQRNDPNQNDCLEATIMKNVNAWLATISACPAGYSTSSNMALVWLRAGDKVHVQTRNSNRIFGYLHTTFSGMKVAPH